MQLAISNLATNDLTNITEIGVSLLECVFSKIDIINNLTPSKIILWKDLLPINLLPYSVQSLTYGCGLVDFSLSEFNVKFIDKILDLTKILHIKRLIFGSPTIRRNQPDVNMFKYIDERLLGTDTFFCIEPNARIYGGHYFFDIEEIYSFITKNKFSNVCTMIDTHNSWLENRDVKEDILNFREKITHVHASEIDLLGFTSIEEHYKVADTLDKINYTHVITLESKNLQGVNEFLKVYGNV